jgi:alpha-1,3-rhamnosyltransferase
MIQQKIRETVVGARNNERVWQQYATMAHNARTNGNSEQSSLSPTDQPLVTVCIAYDRVSEFLAQTLASLANQTYSNLEVLVIDDGSGNANAGKSFDEQQRLYPRFRFIRQQNSNIRAAFNPALEQAKGELFIPMSSSMIASPEMVETFVRSMHHNPNLSALICYGLACGSKNEMLNERFSFAYRPTGWPHVAGPLETAYGETSGVFRTAQLRGAGGFDRCTTCSGTEICTRLLDAGNCVDVIPEHLFSYYRQLAVHARLIAQMTRIPYCRRLIDAVPMIMGQMNKSKNA